MKERKGEMKHRDLKRKRKFRKTDGEARIEEGRDEWR